jgi:ParB family chromosome partitioning protein
MSGELDRLPGLFDPAAPATATDINDIDTTLIDPFPSHPYHVHDDEDMNRLTDSIILIGITTPLTLRATDTQRYQLVSGHRRLHAARRIGLATVPATVEDMDDDQATIRMVDSNLQRTGIPISTQARALAMRHQAITHQGTRRGGTTSRQQLAGATGSSASQVARLVRLARLDDSILALVDSKRLGQRAALELTELTPDEQHALVEYMEHNPNTGISIEQAKTIRKQSGQDPGITTANLTTTLTRPPEPKTETISIPVSWIPQHIPPTARAAWIEHACRDARQNTKTPR